MYSTANLKLRLIGDFNSRVGERQKMSDNPITLGIENNDRCSKHKVVNKYGEKLLNLLDDFNLIILNGRTKNYKNTKFTYISEQGCCVVGYLHP